MSVEQNQQVAQLVQRLPGMVYRCGYSKDWRMEFVSEGVQALTGFDSDELVDSSERSYGDLIHPDDVERVYDAVEAAITKRASFNCEYRIFTKQTQLKWVWEQGLGIFDDAGRIVSIEGFITDITAQRIEQDQQAEQLSDKNKELLLNLALLDEYKCAVDESAIVTKTDRHGRIVYANDEFCRISGYPRAEILGKSHNIIRHPENSKEFFNNLWRTIQDKRTWKGVIKNLSKSGETYYVKSTIVPILDLQGEVKEYIAIRSDVTDLVEQEQKLKLQTTDQLTGLPNRQCLIEDLLGDKEQILAVINVLRFKEINEYYGFDTGDQFLCELARIMSLQLQDQALNLYKLPGDEFAILGSYQQHQNDFVPRIETLIDVARGLNFNIQGNSFSVNLVAGISSKKNYYINAEMAASYAKQHGQAVVFFDENIDIKNTLSENVSWTKKLKAAIEDQRVVIFAQPIFCNATNKVYKYECLVRMLDEDGGVISPAQFLTVAKKSRLYEKLTKIVISSAIEFFSQRNESFSINLSLEDILNPSTVEFLSHMLRQHPGVAKRMVLEIVEDEGIENYQQVSRFIEEMKFLGCQIAIDDFGTGYSNFDYLMRLNVDYIKIDGSMVRNIHLDQNARIVTGLIVDFAKRLNIKTIAEFVHCEEVLGQVKALGVDCSQGFYLGEPQALSDIAETNPAC